MKDDESSSVAWAALDLLGNLFLIALVLVAPTRTAPTVPTFGQYAITITWHGEDDVDLWVRDPPGHLAWFGSLSPAGSDMTLGGDDLGTPGTSYGHGQNHERVILRGVIPGEYVANVHLYARAGAEASGPPIRVTVQLWDLRGNDRLVHEQQVELVRNGDERTAFRFSLRQGGKVYGINRLPRALVGAQ